MKQKIRASGRIKRRHILIIGKKDEVEKIILDYLGILGWARASPSFIDAGNGKIVLSVDRKEVDNVRAAFELCKERIRILRVSGTLKGLGK